MLGLGPELGRWTWGSHNEASPPSFLVLQLISFFFSLSFFLFSSAHYHFSISLYLDPNLDPVLVAGVFRPQKHKAATET